jgi:hypothetical protein
MRHIEKTRDLFERLLESEDAAGRGPAFEKVLGTQLTADGFTADNLLSASSFRRSDRPCSLKSAKSGTSQISLSSLALEYILRSARRALLPFEADPGNLSFSTSSLVI